MGTVIYYARPPALFSEPASVFTMIIGTLPVVIPLFANVLYSQRDADYPAAFSARAGAIGFWACCASILLNLVRDYPMLAAGAMVQALCWR